MPIVILLFLLTACNQAPPTPSCSELAAAGEQFYLNCAADPSFSQYCKKPDLTDGEILEIYEELQ